MNEAKEEKRLATKKEKIRLTFWPLNIVGRRPLESEYRRRRFQNRLVLIPSRETALHTFSLSG